MTALRLALISGFLFVGLIVAGIALDHFLAPHRGLLSSAERNAMWAGAIVVAVWLSLPVKGVTLR